MNRYTTEDYIRYRIQRANNTLKEAELLLSNHFWNTAINRMYYACFYAVGALLVKNHIKTTTHTGCRQKFGLHFVKTGIISKELGRHYTELFEKRHKGDYDDFFDYDEESTRKLLEPSKELVNKIEDLLLSNQS